MAKQFGVDRMTLKRYLQKFEDNPSAEMTSDYKKRLIFSVLQENELAEYLKVCAKMNCGLHYKKIRKLAYELAVKNNIARPNTWDLKQMAGNDWMKGFMKRNKTLSLRTPEATSLSRGTSFNRQNVSDFFNNLKVILNREVFDASAMWNIDETGYTTVQKPKKVVATKGQKQIGQITSGERGQLVTICCAVSGSGNSIPPFMVFPRVNFKPLMITGAPKGTVGVAHPTGWMTGENFVQFLKHFVFHVKCSKDNKALMIMDNHDSHITIESLDFAKENGIVLLTLPPHCSNKLQPLDVSVFSSFKNSCDKAANDWMADHPGKVITIYDIAGIINNAFPIPSANIVNGFRKTGIHPFDETIFKDDDFLPSFVTDRPEVDPIIAQGSGPDLLLANKSLLKEPLISNKPSEDEYSKGTEPLTDSVAGPSNVLSTQLSHLESRFSVSPVQVLPYPKAGQRNTKTKGRKKLKSAIITDTPVKNDIQEQLRIRQENKKENEEKKRTRKTKTNQKPQKKSKIEKVKRQVFEETSSSEDPISYEDSDISSYEEEEDIIEFQKLLPVNSNTLKIGKCAIISFKGGRRLTTLYRYLCMIDKVDEDECRVISMKCTNHLRTHFTLSNTDISDVKIEEIIGITPDPTIVSKGERIYYKFNKPLDIFESA